MSNCSNCYNGCTEIVSDKCVKYTGIDVPVLGIQTGDSLSFVEQAIIEFLTSTLTGEGIIINLDDINICAIVQSYLPTCKDLSVVDIIKALIKSICDIQTQVTAINATLTTLNADYTIDCLTGVTASSDTHAIVQATINNLCSLNDDFAAFVGYANSYFINVGNVDDYIQTYLATAIPNKAYTKMIPYSPIPYVGGLSNYPSTGDSFSISGVGSGYWEKIYLCNGVSAPGVPDLRGRVPVGTTTMGNNRFPPATDPGNPVNPTYTINTTQGQNTVTLQVGQIPSHNHLGSTATSISAPHTHTYVKTDNPFVAGNGVDIGYNGVGDEEHIGGTLTQTEGTAAIVTTSLAIAPQGGDGSHINIQPVIATHYIIYIP